MSKEIIYKPTPFQRHQWKYHKMVEKTARDAERVGESRYEAFSDFSAEIFHKMFVDVPVRVEDPAPGTEVYQKLDEQIDKIPEIGDLAKRCKGDERWSGIATASIIDELLRSIPSSDQQIEDPTKDEQVIEYLERLLEETEGEEDQEDIQESINEIKASRDQKVQQSQDAANGMDESDVRNALRRAAKGAAKEIEDEERMMDAFSAGSDIGTSRKGKRAIANKLRKVISGNERMKKIAELAGRLRRIALEQQAQKPRRGTDEVTGIELGDNLSRLIPSETMLMDDSLEMIFAKKLNERALLNTELNKTPPKEQGPIVMLLDSSGSMTYKSADAWAAAVSLAFLEIARKQKRAFSIIHFGGAVRRIDSWKANTEWTADSIIDAISFFASDGGTNFQDPILKGIESIKNEGAFREADIVMITDGCASINDTFLEGVKKEKEELGFSIYSILINDAYGAEGTCAKFSDKVVFLKDAIAEEKGMFDLFRKV